MAVHYVSIREFSDFHQVDVQVVESLIDFGLLPPGPGEGEACIREQDIEALEAMLRLHTELGVNLPGIDAIMHMRHRLEALQQRLEFLERRLRHYENSNSWRGESEEWEYHES